MRQGRASTQEIPLDDHKPSAGPRATMTDEGNPRTGITPMRHGKQLVFLTPGKRREAVPYRLVGRSGE